mmetsp:Transcript_87744/g.131573  ORF Transcript_87744/g.131573 Transcript_87744/m.131573 type:complete len:272 (-) Transcript_87744:1317-2132(-)
MTLLVMTVLTSRISLTIWCVSRTAQLEQYLVRRNVAHNSTERGDLIRLAQEQASAQEVGERKIVDHALQIVHEEQGVDERIRVLREAQGQVKTKTLQNQLKKTLGVQYMKRASSEYEKLLSQPRRTGQLGVSENQALFAIIADYTIAIKCNKKQPEAYGGRGICLLRRFQMGDALKDLATAVSFKYDNHLWDKYEYAKVYEMLLNQYRKEGRFCFGAWKELTLDPSPPPRSLHASCHDGAGRIYICGGQGQGAADKAQFGNERSDPWELDT